MKIAKFLLIAALLFCHQACADERSVSQDSQNVLFIGNSLTSANSMPAMIAGFAQARGKTMHYEVFAPGGYRFAKHLSDPDLLEIIEQGDWDTVVLQEQSQLPAYSKKQVSSGMLYFLYQLYKRIKASNLETKIVFYNTMAHKDGDPSGIQIAEEIGTYEGMQKRINDTYLYVAKNYDGILAPVGQVWQEIRKNRPDINLYADARHPNLAGSYLAACVLYQTLFQDSPVGLPYPGQIPAEIAHTIQETVSSVVVSQDWDYSKLRPEDIQARKEFAENFNMMEIILFLNANRLPEGAASYKVDTEKKVRQYFDEEGNLTQESYINENNEIITKVYNKQGQIVFEHTFDDNSLARDMDDSRKYHEQTVVPAVTSVIKSHAQAVEDYAQTHGGTYPVRMSDLTQSQPPFLAECQCDQNIHMYKINCELKQDGYRFTAYALWPHQESYVITEEGTLTMKKPGELNRYAEKLPSKSPCEQGVAE